MKRNSLIFLIITVLFVGCNNPFKKKKDKVGTITPPSCQEASSCPVDSGGIPPSNDPFPEPIQDPDPMANSFEVIESFPAQDENAFHVDDYLHFYLNKDLDADQVANFRYSGTNLDLVQLRDEGDKPIEIQISALGNILHIRTNNSLDPNTRYSLTLSSELTSYDGYTLDGDYYLSFITDSELGMFPGSDILFSWGREPNPYRDRFGNPTGETFLYEEENYNLYELGLDLFSKAHLEKKDRDYYRTHRFTNGENGYTIDVDLNRYFYQLNMNLIKGRRYFMALEVCRNNYRECSEKSDEIWIDIALE